MSNFGPQSTCRRSFRMAVLRAFLVATVAVSAVPGVVWAADSGAPAAQAAEKAKPEAPLDLTELFASMGFAGWLLVVLAVVLVAAGPPVVAWLIGRMVAFHRVRQHEVARRLFAGAVGPGRLLCMAAGLLVFALGIGLPATGAWDYVHRAILFLIYLAGLWYVSNIAGVVDVYFLRLVGRTGAPIDEAAGPFLRKTLRILLWIFGLLFIASSVFEQDIGAWLTGLGIAGLAVSLAAQDSLKNLFGSVTILADRPFRIGERIVFAGFDGVIEEVGFRSTRMRTLTGHLVTIPNSKMTNEAVENISRRPSIRRLFHVTVPYDTPLEKVRRAVQIVRDVLEEEGIREPIHPVIDGNEYPPRVYFNEFNPDSLNIFVIYWFAPPAYWDYLEHAEKVNFRIMEEFEKEGIEFAFPTQTLYLAGDPRRRLAVECLGPDAGPPQ